MLNNLLYVVFAVTLHNLLHIVIILNNLLHSGDNKAGVDKLWPVASRLSVCTDIYHS